MTLSLTFDHRAVDGAPAAAFLQSVGQRLEHAEETLAGNATLGS
jgi:pyruvate dehydrogenase E2 component (dihydrolipoamide acetyltransferase)